MLDFYKLSDLEYNVHAVTKDDFLGGLSLNEHKALQPVFKNSFGIDIHPFQDSRLSATQVRHLYDVCIEHQRQLLNMDCSEARTLEKFCSILQNAVDKGTGIVTVCD